MILNVFALRVTLMFKIKTVWIVTLIVNNVDKKIKIVLNAMAIKF